MDSINQLIALGGNSMIAILITSVLMLAMAIYKLVQFSVRGYWTIKTPTVNDIGAAMSGLKLIEVASVIAPLLGLLGTVMGMISAFQALEAAGGSPEVSILASGIWRALSTTAAGMVVAILATIFLGLFDGAVERMTTRLEAEK